MRWGTIGMGGAWVLIGGPMRWGTSEMGDQWDGGPLGLAENGWTNEKGDQWEGGPMSSNNVVGDLWIGAPMRRGPMRWGTNEMGDQWVGGTNEMGDQWNEWCMGANWGINEMGDQWDGGPMRWGTNEMGDQWDGGPMMCTRSTGSLNHQFSGSYTMGSFSSFWLQLLFFWQFLLVLCGFPWIFHFFYSCGVVFVDCWAGSQYMLLGFCFFLACSAC